MSVSCSYPIRKLNQETRDYLQRVWRERAANHPGVFVPRSNLALIALAGLVGLVLLATIAKGLDPRSLYSSLGIQCSLTAVGLLCLLYCGRKVSRQFHSKALGEFTYCDGTWNWEVRGPRVKVTDVSKVAAVQIMQRLRNGVPIDATVELEISGGGKVSFPFSNSASAQHFGRFLQTCRAVRYRCFMGEFSPAVRQFVADPAGLAQMARRVMDSPNTPVSLEHRALIPIPNPPQFEKPGAPFREFGKVAALGCAIFTAGWFGFPPIRYLIDHHHHYAMVKSSPAADTESPRTYLEKFPHGKYADEVRTLLDDRLFAKAAEDAQRLHSPAAVRNYLAGQPHERHETEARQIIGRFYDEARTRLQILAVGQNTETELLNGLLAVLDHLKSQPTPRVTVSFQPSWTISPDNETLWSLEKKFESAYAQRDAVIDSMIHDKGTAVVGTGETFSEKQVRRRESVILRRLSAAVAKILSADIIAFAEGSGKEASDLTVRYDIRPRGQLVRYVRIPDELLPEAPRSSQRNTTTNTLGLLREYTIDWQLTIDPGANRPSHLYKASSTSGTNLVYRTKPGDPEWGAYAVLMYSAFYDFSNRMLTGVGLTPPPAPTTFTFHDAVNREW